ncbi:RING finger protein [Pseudohyphozyma bogoriensis]|nr:RING finger protein [Pseudohyphozyma bogoriensis]
MAAPKDLTIYYTTSELQEARLFSNGPYIPALSPSMPQAAFEFPVVISAASAPQLCQLVDQYQEIKSIAPPPLSPDLDLIAARISVEQFITEHLPILRLTIFAPAVAYAVSMMSGDVDLAMRVSMEGNFLWTPLQELYETAFSLGDEERRQVQVLMTLCMVVCRQKAEWHGFARELDELDASSSTRDTRRQVADGRPFWQKMFFDPPTLATSMREGTPKLPQVASYHPQNHN